MNLKTLLCFLFVFSATVIPQEREITKESLLKKVEILTSEEFDGRLPGSDGYEKAAQYSAEIFEKAGLAPIDDESYFQTLYVEYNNIKAPAAFKVEGEVSKEYKLGQDYIFRGFTGSGNFTAPVVFCGYGISDPLYDDYKDIDANGKIVIAFKAHPRWNIEGHTFTNSYPREKANVAAQHGAKAILFVSFPNDKEPQELIASVLHGSGEQNENFPQLHISINAADDLLSGTGYTLKDLQTLIDSTKNPYSLELKNKAHITATAEYTHAAPVKNVAGVIHGSDPLLKDEYIVIGAHLDHVGSQAGEVLFPGANDNASGSAGVLEIAEVFIKNNIKPKRSVIFVLFASEEQGLNGAQHFVKHPPVPVDKITAMINMDCIGYGDSIRIGNGNSSPVLWNMIRDIDKQNFNMMVESTWKGGGADAAPFHEAGVPAAYFVTTNSYKHLHLPTDTVDTLNGGLFEKMVRLAYLTVKEIADGNYDREEVID
jgi:aminopeptidase YwaD